MGWRSFAKGQAPLLIPRDMACSGVSYNWVVVSNQNITYDHLNSRQNKKTTCMEDNFTRLMENFTYDPMEISWCLGIGWGMHEPLQLNETEIICRSSLYNNLIGESLSFYISLTPFLVLLDCLSILPLLIKTKKIN